MQSTFIVCDFYIWKLKNAFIKWSAYGPHMHLDVLAISAQGWIQDESKFGNKGSPSSKNFFRLERYSNKPYS